MPSRSEIIELKTYLVDSYYSATRRQQATDDQFYKDTFSVPQITNPKKIQRTGRASRLIDAPAEHIITSNPQVFRNPLKDSKGAEQSALNVATECNRWVQAMKRNNPNPFKEYVKNLLLRGEAWVHPIHNSKWVTGKKERMGLPVYFTIPDPMVIYADPNEDENGIPERVIVYYERSPWIVKSIYPEWDNPKNKGVNDTISWMEYWDKETCYADADEKPVYKGEFKRNIYGVVPFVHKLSGFGKSSPDGSAEDLIVGRLRKVRDVLVRECAIVSDIDSTFHLFANNNIDVQPIDDQHSVPNDFRDNYVLGAGEIHELPYGIKVEKSEVMLPEPQVFQYLYTISSQLDREDPLVMGGAPVGESGRLQDMVGTSAMKRYETIVENTEHAFATALGMGLKMCCDIPTLCPEEYGMSKKDVNENYVVEVKLKADDPIDADRKATLGSRLVAQGEIDPMTNLIQYKGYTAEKSKQILIDILKWKVLLTSPDIAELIGLRAAEKSGMSEDLQILKQRRMQLEQQGKQLQGQPPPSSQQRAMGEVGSQSGREMIDMALQTKGSRKPPVNYTRNG